MSQELPESAELAKIHERFIEAFRNNDFDTLRTFYADSAVLLPPGRPLVMGADDIVTYWQEAQVILDLKFETTDAKLISNDVVREVGKLDILMRGTGREARARATKYVLIWVKTGGTWKITTKAWSGISSPVGRGRQGGRGGEGGGGRRSGQGQGDGVGGEGRQGGGGRAGGGGQGGGGQGGRGQRDGGGRVGGRRG